MNDTSNQSATTAPPTIRLVAPHIHLNGTSADELKSQLEAVYVALGEAYAALKQSVPNGRDYYPLGDVAMQVARDQHFRRLEVVQSLRDEMEMVCDMIDRRHLARELPAKTFTLLAYQ